MLNGRAVLRQVRRGRLPPFWRLYRWSYRSDFLRLLLSAVVLGVVALIALVGVQSAVFTSPAAFNALTHVTSGPSSFAVVVALSACLAAIVLVLAPLAVGMRALVALLLPVSSRPVLVLLPEGCVERTGTLVRRIRVVSYADIGQIELQVRKLRPSDYKSASDLPLATTRTSIRLILHYWNGKPRSWLLRREFGMTALLAQAIISAHGQYSNSISARRPRVRPTSTSTSTSAS